MPTTKINHKCKCGSDRSPDQRYCKDCQKLADLLAKVDKELKARQTNNSYKMSDELENKLETIRKHRK